LFSFIAKQNKDEDGRIIESSKRRFLFPFHTLLLGIGAITFFITMIIVRIGAQDAGVVVTPSGVDDNELHTGWHIVMPWNSVYIMDKTVWVYTCAQSKSEGAKPNADAIWAPTKDGIKMGFDVSVSWRIIATEASWI
jgi:hypothetical protein